MVEISESHSQLSVGGHIYYHINHLLLLLLVYTTTNHVRSTVISLVEEAVERWVHLSELSIEEGGCTLLHCICTLRQLGIRLYCCCLLLGLDDDVWISDYLDYYLGIGSWRHWNYITYHPWE